VQQHECENKLLILMINFKLMKIYYFPMFHEHQKYKIKSFLSISNMANFRVLQYLSI
jgi:hypothetical protein